MFIKKCKYSNGKTFVSVVHGYKQVGGQAVLGRQIGNSTPWLTERHGYDPTYS